jgi:hypothetical protein
MPTKKPKAVLETRTSRRELLKKAAYATPVILTLAATPAFAGKGSKGDNPSRRKDRKGSKKY